MEATLLLDTASAVVGKSGLRIIGEWILSHWEIVTAIGTAIAGAGTFLCKKLIRIKKWVMEINLLKQELPEIKTVLFEIRDQFKTNGGSSLREPGRFTW